MKPSFLLLTCTVRKNAEVANQLCKIYGIKEAVPVHGTYDCIVKTNEMSAEDVDTLVNSSLRPLSDVHSILTLHTNPHHEKFVHNSNTV